MKPIQEFHFSTLQYYATAPYPCSYLENVEARSQVATPSHKINADVYSDLIKSGFRRSGIFTYRPHCDNCRSCIPVRVKTQFFIQNRNQRRAWKKHRHLTTRISPLIFEQSHYELYLRYQLARHTQGDIDQDSRDQYAQFLLQSKVNTRLVEFFEPDGTLRMVSIIDIVDDGLSSVYTFYDPDVLGASFGTYNIIWQIQQAKQLNMPHLYLGYWIKNNSKMAYKTNFQPLEALHNQTWGPL